MTTSTQVLLDDGTGAYPYDVSAFVRMIEGAAVSGFGRTDEFTQPGASTLAVTLDNNDGTFTAGIADLQVNGSFESAFTTGGVVGSATRFSFDTAAHLSGARSVKVAPLGGDTGNLGFQADRVAATPGVAYVGSIYAKRAAGAGTIRVDIQFLNAALASLGSASTVTDLTTTNAPIGSWVRALSTGTAPALTAWVRIRVFYTSYVGGTDVANFDLAQLEVGTVPSFFVQPGTGIRYVETIGATTSNRFTGSVDSLQLGWPGGGQEYAVVNVSATDGLADLGGHTLKSMLEEEILLDAPSAYYTLGEAEGSTAAGDTSGNQAATVTITGTGAPVTFGSGTGPTDGLSAVVFAGGQYLTVQMSAGFTLAAVECWASGTSTPDVDLFGTQAGPLVTQLDPAHLAGLIGTSASAGNWTNDGTLHHVVYVPAVGMYLDDLLWASVNTPPSVSTLTIGGSTASAATPWVGTIANVVIYATAPSGARVAAHFNVGAGATESTDARLTRLASYAGLTATTANASGQLMGAQATSGQSLFDAMQTVATAEGGVLYADGSGALKMQGRNYRGLETTPAYTATEQGVAPDTAVTWDRQQLVNQVTVTRTGGATQVVKDGTPVRLFPASLDLAVDTDANALYAAQWLLAKHKATSPRLASVKFDLLTASDAASVLALNIGDRVSLPAMPSQMWPAADYTIEGWAETHTATEHSLTFNLLPWTLAQAWVLGDATYGVLGTTTILGY